jgi:serine phosphatase RsbU (regulator of sigma subunit)
VLDAVDGAATPLGPREGWSSALRGAVELALGTRFPITLLWGPEFVLVYNEAYTRLIADKHPAALGRPAREVFPEAWPEIGPMLEGVLAGEGATYLEDLHVPLWRDGRLEECYFTFSYSPVRGEEGAIEGVLDVTTETTRQVLDRRRLMLLTQLAVGLTDLERPVDLPDLALPLLLSVPEDLPAADIRLPGGIASADPRLPAGPGPGTTAPDVRIETTAAGEVAWVPIAGGHDACLVVLLSEHHPPDEIYLDFLRLVGATLSLALNRVAARQAERGMSEALQRSLLAAPAEPEGLQVAVRYQAAAEQAQIGGDWYDAFTLPGGQLTVVVGDVTGHDQRAAAAMAQVRNLLRGVAWTVEGSPAQVLDGLDEAMQGLGIDVFATAILAQLQDGRLAWANAGHLAPVLLGPDGSARLLQTAPDPLLGIGAARRSDHAGTLAPGAALVLYTDGLIERRGVPLQESMEWLVGVVEGHAELSAAALADRVMRELGDDVEDDVALLVVRAEP